MDGDGDGDGLIWILESWNPETPHNLHRRVIVWSRIVPAGDDNIHDIYIYILVKGSSTKLWQTPIIYNTQHDFTF